MYHQLKFAFMACLWVPRMICMLVLDIVTEVLATTYEIMLLLLEFIAHLVAPLRFLILKQSISETPHRVRQLMMEHRGLWGMDDYKRKVHKFLESQLQRDSILGFWGISGVGKTRLLFLIGDCYGDVDSPFRYIIAVKHGDVRDMQQNIASFLNLDWNAMSSSQENCLANSISEKLKNASFLLMLDYVEDGDLNLASIGLPMPLRYGQKVILTSKSQAVCGRMGCTKANIVEMKCLGEEDAWNLFKYKAGVEITEDDVEIHKMAKLMVSACGGLPKAICSIGIGIAGATCSGHPDDWWFAYERFKANKLRGYSGLELKMLVAQHLFSLQLIQFFQNITFLDLEGVTLFSSQKGKTQASSSIHEHSQSDKCPWEIICELTELQHLNLSATALRFLPELLEKLSKLEYLYIRNNIHLQTIPRRLILALKKLRGLDLFSTGACYEVLQELASSTIDLKMLGFTVRTVGEITKLAQLETVCTQALCMQQVQDESDPDIMNLKFLSKLRELRELAIVQSFDSQKVLVVEGGPESDYYQQLLPQLEIFELNYLRNLEKVIWKNAGISIRVVSICDCDKLRDVTWVHHLKYLEELTVSECKGMERLIEIGESSQDVAMNQTATISFPRLQKLTLKELPKLTMISQQACQFEDLSCISVTRCNVIKSIHAQQYKKFIKIHCNEDWWTESKSEGRSNPYLVPKFIS